VVAGRDGDVLGRKDGKGIVCSLTCFSQLKRLAYRIAAHFFLIYLQIAQHIRFPPSPLGDRRNLVAFRLARLLWHPPQRLAEKHQDVEFQSVGAKLRVNSW
jgi:hypothetical protein